MTRILGISFDGVASPSITLKPGYFGAKEEAVSYGWGYGWYQEGQKAATILKDATASDSNAINQLLTKWQRFHSTVFICHLRGAAKSITQQSTQPFSRSYAGRDWIMLHNGDIAHYKEVLKLDETSVFEPLGKTDSEHMFCWLMQQIYLSGARRIADIDKKQLLQWLNTINALGTVNIMLSDGDSLLVYQDMNHFNTLKWCRRHPPYTSTVLESDDVKVDLSSSFDQARTMVVFATQAMTDETWIEMQPGQVLIVKRGWILWDSVKKKTAAPQSVTLTEKRSTTKEPFVMTIYHRTRYQYETNVELSKHLFYLQPVDDEVQKLLSFELTITPGCDQVVFDDVFNNRGTFAVINKPYKELTVLAKSTVKVNPQAIYNGPLAMNAQKFPVAWMPWQQQALLPFLLPPELPIANLEELLEYAMTFVKRNDADFLSVLNDINRVIHEDYTYQSQSTSLDTTPYEVYVARKGVCQDFANLFICLARLLNIPARYRTGYIYTGSDYENKIQSDASHAWVEVYIPMVGWRGYDPTNGILAGTDHVRVASGRNYRDVTPTSGTIYEGGSAKEIMEIDVKVTREE